MTADDQMFSLCAARPMATIEGTLCDFIHEEAMIWNNGYQLIDFGFCILQTTSFHVSGNTSFAEQHFYKYASPFDDIVPDRHKHHFSLSLHIQYNTSYSIYPLLVSRMQRILWHTHF